MNQNSQNSDLINNSRTNCLTFLDFNTFWSSKDNKMQISFFKKGIGNFGDGAQKRAYIWLGVQYPV